MPQVSNRPDFAPPPLAPPKPPAFQPPMPNDLVKVIKVHSDDGHYPRAAMFEGEYARVAYWSEERGYTREGHYDMSITLVFHIPEIGAAPYSTFTFSSVRVAPVPTESGAYAARGGGQ